MIYVVIHVTLKDPESNKSPTLPKHRTDTVNRLRLFVSLVSGAWETDVSHPDGPMEWILGETMPLSDRPSGRSNASFRNFNAYINEIAFAVWSDV